MTNSEWFSLDAKRPVSFPLEDKHVVNEHHVARKSHDATQKKNALTCAFPRGGYLTKFNTGRLRLEVQPLTLLYTILAEKVPLLYTIFLRKGAPFTYLL